MNTPFVKSFIFLALAMTKSLAAPQQNPQIRSLFDQPALQSFEGESFLTSGAGFDLMKEANDGGAPTFGSSTAYNRESNLKSASSVHFPRDSLDSSEFSDLRFLRLFLTIHSIFYDFYDTSFSSFSASDFKKAGYPRWVWLRFHEIQDDSKDYKEFWKSTISSLASQEDIEFVKPIFQFNRHDVRSFVDHSLALETTATSCYVGAIPHINDRGYLTAVASIISETSKHSAWINAAVKAGSPWNGPFETAITPSQCLSTISNAVSNAPSIFTDLFLSSLPPDTKIHPHLQLSNSLVPGQEAQITFNDTAIKSDPNAHLYGVFLHGTDTIFARITKNETTTLDSADTQTNYFIPIPLSLHGSSFFYVSRIGDDNLTRLTMNPDQDVIAGPTLVIFEYGSG